MWLTLVAMTLASSMILVDQTAVPLASPDVVQGLGGNVADGQWILTANILPLAAFMVLGGRLGDLFGLRRVFLTGAVLFAIATALASAAQSLVWIIAMRAAQGTAAALMMPTAVAITSAVWPRDRRGYALGILAGGSSFFAALGPVLGGVLTSVSWRLVFLINVPLALAAIVLTLAGTPDLPPDPHRRHLDWGGTSVFAVAIVALIYGLSRGQPDGWLSPSTVVPLALSVVAFALFCWIEQHVGNPLIDFRLFRRLNFLASTLSQVIAGAIELGLGYLLPFYLLLVVGVGPVTAGIALIPGTIPIILAGPLAGRAFDRLGGRVPLVAGFIVLALSGVAMGVAATGDSAVGLIPGLLLQGAGLGIVLTVNDPVGMNAVDEADSGQAAGIINTAEQMGGAIGIAGLGAAQLGYYFHLFYARLAARGITNPTPAQIRTVKDYVYRAEIKGLHNVRANSTVQSVMHDLVKSHAQSFQFAFYLSAGVALLGAVMSWVLVRKQPRSLEQPIFGRRSRWVHANVGETPAVSRVPPEALEHGVGLAPR